MASTTARVFQSGNSQALRLPKSFRLKSKSVKLVKTTDGFSVHDDDEQSRRVKAFSALAGSCPDFPEIEPTRASNLRRDWE